MSEKILKYRIYIFEALFFAALLAVDLISKSAAFSFLADHGGHYVLYEGIYELIEVHNDGASFGIFGGETTALIVFTAVAMAALAAVLIARPRTPRIFRSGFIAIIAGGVGNLVDRIAFGYVRDFIDYTFLRTFFGIENFGVGNIADIFVLVGLLCIIVYVFFGYKEGDFAKNPRPSDDLPETLVVNEGEQQGEGSEAEKENVVRGESSKDADASSSVSEKGTDAGALKKSEKTSVQPTDVRNGGGE